MSVVIRFRVSILLYTVAAVRDISSLDLKEAKEAVEREKVFKVTPQQLIKLVNFCCSTRAPVDSFVVEEVAQPEVVDLTVRPSLHP